jgi:hypothetical protein
MKVITRIKKDGDVYHLEFVNNKGLIEEVEFSEISDVLIFLTKYFVGVKC